MKVIAVQLGYDNVQLRNPGDEFDMPDTIFDGGGQHWFEPVDPDVKAKVAAERKKSAKPAVAAIDPAKQAAEHEASIKAINEKHALTLKGLQDEIDELKKAQPKTK